jgi:hypothetical protein
MCGETRRVSRGWEEHLAGYTEWTCHWGVEAASGEKLAEDSQRAEQVFDRKQTEGRDNMVAWPRG